MRTTIEESFVPKYFCSTHGHMYDVPGKCTLCDTELIATAINRVQRVCGSCNEEFEATVGYFESHPECPACKDGILGTLPPNDTHSFVIDGQWNGVPIGKKVRERNEMLKKRHAGYSYETQASMKDTAEAKLKSLKEKGIR